jgi:cytochrome c6
MRRILVLAVLLSGCGNSAEQGPKTPKQTFAGTCGTCHTLKNAGTSGTFGPDLDTIKPSKARVVAQIKRGGGGMPAGLLVGAQADAVATYVSSVAGQ